MKTPQSKIHLTCKLLKKAEPVWLNFCINKAPTYTDSITGLRHTVRTALIGDVLMAAQKNPGPKRLQELLKEFEDPAIALQDGDWNPPESVAKIFYSALNLLNFLSGNPTETEGETTLSIAINQAIDALENSQTLAEEQIKKILEES